MRFRARRDDRALTETTPRVQHELDDELGDECEALLSGHYLTHAQREGYPLHGWMWLNLAAHGSLEDVAAAAVGAGTPGWDAAATVVASATLASAKNRAGLHALQETLLIPLELRLIDEEVTPRRLLEVTLAALYGSAPE